MNNKQVSIRDHSDSFDFLRTCAMLGVILYHVSGAYSTLAPYWPVQDTQHFLGYGLRALLDVFIMPFFLFIAGYFALPSIENKTLGAFILNKFTRLGTYWIFIVLIFHPFVLWKILELSGSYFDYWLHYLLNIEKITIGPLKNAHYSHMHFWFISLLFYIFILFGALYKIFDAYLDKKIIKKKKAYEQINVSDLLILGFFTTVVYFISILFFPDSSWIIIPLIFQSKITQLGVLILYFGFGVYSRYRGWFDQINKTFKQRTWISSVILLTVLFFIIGQNLFNNIDISNTLSPLYLFIFSLIRSFLLLSYLMLFSSLAIKHFNRKNPIIRNISDVSYEIYIVHIFFVTPFQSLFQRFEMIPVAVKISTIFIIGTVASYFFGKYTLYKFPKICATVTFFLFFILMVLFNR